MIKKNSDSNRNNASRNNCGTRQEASQYEDEGVYIAAVGARFERKDQMESLHMLVDPERTTEAAGYGARGQATALRAQLAPFAKLYGCGDGTNHFFPSAAEVQAKVNAAGGSLERAGFVQLRTGRLLNINIFSQRYLCIICLYYFYRDFYK